MADPGIIGRLARLTSELAALLLVSLSCLPSHAASLLACTQGSSVSQLRGAVALMNCQVETMGKECKDWFRAHPDTIEFARDCKDPNDNRWDTTKLLEACGGAIGEAWAELWAQAAKSVGDSYKRNRASEKACDDDETLECKRQLAREANVRFGNLDELREVPTTLLLRKRQNVREMARRDESYRKKLIASGVPLPDDRNGYAGVAPSAFLAVIHAKIKELGVKAECYNGAGYLHMACYATATILDPTVVATGGAMAYQKGGAFLSRVLGTAKRVSALEARTLEAQTAKAAERFVMSEVEIPKTHRPEKPIPDSGREVSANEVISGGHIPRSAAETEAFIKSPGFKDGTYVVLVVRENGKDVPMFVNRVPTDPALAAQGKINTHRTLRQTYRDAHGGKDPDVVGAGECILNMAGAIVSCINRSGSYYEGNLTPDYMLDAMEASGFRRSEQTNKVTFTRGQNEEAGHMLADEAVHVEQEIERHYPGLLADVREFSRNIYANHAAEDGLTLEEKWRKGANKNGLLPDPSWPAEKAQAYAKIRDVFTMMKEGSTFATARSLQAWSPQAAAGPRRIAFDSAELARDIELIKKYMPEFIRDAAGP